MKKFIHSIIISLLYFNVGLCQIKIQETTGGSVVTKLGYGIAVNEGSTLNRLHYTLNDESCPVQLANTGITANYTGSGYNFKPVGKLLAKEQITAYELHSVLYDIFGEKIKTLSNSDIVDVIGMVELEKVGGSWYATENQVKEFFVVVTYVANVRTQDGTIWRYKPMDIKEELNKIKIKYEEGYAPKKEEEK